MIPELVIILVAGLALAWAVLLLFMSAPDHSRYDQPQHRLHRDPASVSAENNEVLRLINLLQQELRGTSRLQRLHRLREIFDDGFTESPNTAAALGVAIESVDAGGVAAEWVLAPGADGDRRLLYIHGGAFAIGSPVSHRMITAALSRACGVAVLAIDYRLLPEKLRRAAIADCQAAYRYVIGHGLSGPGDADEIHVAGDSAGGNLTLMLAAWIRDRGLRAPDSVIAFSPSTDATLSNPSMTANIRTDPLLGPGLGPLARLPETVRILLASLSGMSNPRNPRMSPLFGNLGGLPPTLVQVSDCEMLRDDGLRYVNKARSQGSPVTVQVWPDMVHVWQMFQHVLPEAAQAIDEVATFMAANSPRQKTAELTVEPYSALG